MNEKIIFAKYNSSRKKQFRTVTKIIKANTDEKYVRKIALSKEAKTHLEHIADSYSLLKKKYENERVVLVECCHEQKSLRFPYVTGASIENILDDYLKQNDMYSFRMLIKEYFDYIISMTEYGEFETNDEFERIFGKQSIMQTAYIAAPANIDLIFSNIIVKDTIWHIIDYEWIYNFNVPAKYLLYRAMEIYISGNYLLRRSVKDLMLQLFELDENDIALYKNMEEYFQKYVIDNETNKLKISLKKETYDITDIQRLKGVQEFQVFFDYGEGFSEENSYKIYLSNNSIYNLNVQIPSNAKAVRIDPGSSICEIQIVSCSGKKKNAASLVKYNTNGLSITNNRLIFFHNDPQIIIEQEIDIFEEIDVLLSINELSFNLATQIVANAEETIELREQLTNLQNKYVELKTSNDIVQDNMRKEIQKLSGNNANLISENQLLQQEMQVLSTKLNEVENKKQDLDSEVQQLIANNANLISENQLLQQEIQVLSTKLNELENKRQDLDNELQRINNSLIGKLFFAK